MEKFECHRYSILTPHPCSLSQVYALDLTDFYEKTDSAAISN